MIIYLYTIYTLYIILVFTKINSVYNAIKKLIIIFIICKNKCIINIINYGFRSIL